MTRSKFRSLLAAVVLSSLLGTAAVAEEAVTFERGALKDVLAPVASASDQAAIVGRELAMRAVEGLRAVEPDRPRREDRLAAVTTDGVDRS